MEYKIVSSLGELAAYRDMWARLHARCHGGVFSSYEWTIHQLSLTADTMVVIIEQSGEALFILPIKPAKLSKKIPVQIYEHACTHYTDYQEVLFDRLKADTVLSFFWSQTVKQFPVFTLKIDNLRSTPHSVLFRRSAKNHKVLLHGFKDTLLIDLKKDYATKKIFREIARRKKNLESEHHVKINMTEAISDESIRRLFQLNRSQYGVNPLNQPGLEGEKLNLFQSVSDFVMFSSIRVDGDLASAHLGFVVGAEFYYYVPVTDREYAKYGLGFILFSEILAYCKENGIEKINFLRGDEGYKYKWFNTVEKDSGALFADRRSSAFLMAVFEIWAFRN